MSMIDIDYEKLNKYNKQHYHIINKIDDMLMGTNKFIEVLGYLKNNDVGIRPDIDKEKAHSFITDTIRIVENEIDKLEYGNNLLKSIIKTEREENRLTCQMYLKTLDLKFSIKEEIDILINYLEKLYTLYFSGLRLLNESLNDD